MHVAIAGAGKVGSFLAGQLSEAGHSVVVLEQDARVAKRLQGQNPAIRVEIGDACEVSFLEHADLKAVDVLVAATGDDEDNLVISLLGKQEFAVPRVVARVNHPHNEWLFNETWGVDVSVSTPHLLTAVVEEAVSVGALVRLLQFDRANARLVEVTLAADSPSAGTSLADLAFPRDATIVAVLRQGCLVVPRGDTVLVVNDEVIVLVTGDSEEPVRKLLVA
jgi:trk/ktr system potassium uptake protein